MYLFHTCPRDGLCEYVGVVHIGANEEDCEYFYIQEYGQGTFFVLFAVVSMILSMAPVSFLLAEVSLSVSVIKFSLSVIPNPPGNDADFEYITISNIGGIPVDLTGWKLLSGSAEIPLHGVSESDLDISACSNTNVSENGNINCQFSFSSTFHLVNTGGSVSLVAPDGVVVVETSWGNVSNDETLTPIYHEGLLDVRDNVSICHRSTDTGLFDPKISIATDIFFQEEHDVDNDITPPFFYLNGNYMSFYSGKNWSNSTSQEIWNNNCALPVHDAITVVKMVDDASGQNTNFNFNFNFNDDDDDADFSLPGGGQFTFADLDNTYQLVHEYETVGWNLDDIVCESTYSSSQHRSDITYDFVNAEVEVDLDRGDHLICTFFNSKDQSPTGTIIVKKVVNNDLFVDIAPSFNFYSNWDGPLLLRDGEIYTSNPLSIFEGPYSITEYTTVGWESPEVSCVSDMNPDRLISNQEILLEDGETVTCTFDNTRNGALYPIRGYTWDDTNGNGQWDDDELSVSEQTIALRSMNLRPVEELYIPADGTIVTTSHILDAQKIYVIEVQGAYQYKESTAYRYADAEWAYRNDIYVDVPLLSHQWTVGELTYQNPNDLDITINNKNIDWGSFNGVHLYKTILQGTGSIADFSIADNSYGDNHGGLNVVVYDVTPYVTTTDENGLYSFSVPLGEYQIIKKTEKTWVQTFPQSPSYYHITVSNDHNLLYSFGNKPADVLPMGNFGV